MFVVAKLVSKSDYLKTEVGKYQNVTYQKSASSSFFKLFFAHK